MVDEDENEAQNRALSLRALAQRKADLFSRSDAARQESARAEAQNREAIALGDAKITERDAIRSVQELRRRQEELGTDARLGDI